MEPSSELPGPVRDESTGIGRLKIMIASTRKCDSMNKVIYESGRGRYPADAILPDSPYDSPYDFFTIKEKD